jgi:hypothetical protein
MTYSTVSDVIVTTLPQIYEKVGYDPGGKSS